VCEAKYENFKEHILSAPHAQRIEEDRWYEAIDSEISSLDEKLRDRQDK
jgi:hypothetical protein